MNKKSKAKNRPKVSKTPQETHETVNVENVSNTEEIDKDESLNKVEVKVTELNVEPIAAVEEMLPTCDAPEKPKRSKAKKKQDTTASKDSITNINLSENVTKDESIGNEIQEADIVPVARKKKNKGKKNTDQSKSDMENESSEFKEVKEEPKVTETKSEEKILPRKETEELETSKLPDIKQKDSLTPKKKKKKKHRHDSEKSDVNDTCTLAFQQLLETSDNINEQNLINELDTKCLDEQSPTSIPAVINEIDKSQDFKESLKEEGSKSKKKNKKGKKNLLETDSDVITENKTEPYERIENIIKDENKVSEFQSETSEDLSLKPKAKIIKPVQKKRKTKSESQDTNKPVSLDKDAEKKDKEIVLDTPGSFVDSKNEEKENKEIIADNKNISDSIIIVTCVKRDSKETDNITLQEISDEIDSSKDPLKILHSLETANKEIEPKLPDVTLSEKDIVNKDVHKKTIQEDDTGFKEVKMSKHKKKRHQNIEPVLEVAGSVATTAIECDAIEKETQCDEDKKEMYFDMSLSDKEENIIKSEELEGLSIVTPDLIQYPRSTSQQHIDDNNNTVIAEITTPEEIQLGIPIYTAPPIIQGSGESPDNKTVNAPITIKVIEVDSKDNKNKNDLKSRMFEVNKDMEELRRSIERSLAELTGADKCDSEVDKEFDELFKNQVSEIQQTSDDKMKLIQEDENAGTVTTPIDNISKLIEPEKEKKSNEMDLTNKPTMEDDSRKPVVQSDSQSTVPVCPARNKVKSKSKKKGKKESLATSSGSPTTQQTESTNKDSSKMSKDSEKTEQKSESSSSSKTSGNKGKQQSMASNEQSDEIPCKQLKLDLSFEPIENFEDALTSSADDVNKTFEIIANEAAESLRKNNPQINIIAPIEDTEDDNKEEKKEKRNSVSQPKNLLGQHNIPVSSDKDDYKKEKNKPPNMIQAKVKIKDSVDIEKVTNKKTKESQTDNKKKLMNETNGSDTYSYLSNTNDDFVYKYSFRRVFLQNSCHVCKKEFIHRFPCKFCSLVFYCSQKHQDDDWPKHQSLCFAVSTIAHLKEQKHIYGDAQNVTGHEYRVLRMQMILSCEKILKRKLVPWEQEALLYPRICADSSCRQWHQRKLKDCECCGQISYCMDHPEHLPSSHQRWCKSYTLYQKLVTYQQTKGRLEPRLPTKVMERYQIPEKINEVLGSMYEEKIDMDDIQYAALTQIASAPLTTAYGYQLYIGKMNNSFTNGISKKPTFTIHAIGSDLQFEADALNKWEVFFLHLRPDVQDLRVVLIGQNLNPSNLPLDLLGKIKLCENCRLKRRRVLFNFHDKETYHDYYSSDDFIAPDIVCAFNPNIQRSCMYNMKDNWPSTINSVLKQKIPFIITSYTIEELERDIKRVKECARCNVNVILEPKHNPFSSLRPDRNFITDHETPLLFRNYCYSIMCGGL